MQGSQRTRYNHCLEYSVQLSNEMEKPLIVIFNLVDNYPEANERHYAFMLEGLKGVRASLKKRGIDFYLLHGDMVKNIVKCAQESSILLCDKGYTAIQKKWRREIGERVECSMVEVDTNLVVPVEEASFKEEYSARTIRGKINKQIDSYLHDFQSWNYKKFKKKSEGYILHVDEITNLLDAPLKLLKELKLDRSVGKSKFFKGGEVEAVKFLEGFLDEKLDSYSDKSSDPGADNVSKLSPYLHFGQISPLEITLKVLERKSAENKESVEGFLEELIVRRELAFNFVYYNEEYDKWKGITYNWAYESLKIHEKDEREQIYTLEELEKGVTHDVYWNTAQKEMVETGFMHGYMRMYWCKKILEWTPSPKEAYERTIYLNNRYFLDGRDPNSYTGVAWCFGKHDRAWKEREIFGKVRYMNFQGLKKKFKMEEYIKRVEEICSS